MRTKLLIVVVSLVAVAVACSQSQSPAPSPVSSNPASTAAVDGQGGGASPLSAVIQFGQENAGSPFPPGSGHDQSGHAADNLVPRTVVIGVGGTVTFNVPAAVHQIRIYKPGTEPSDISLANLTTLAAHAGCGAPLPPQVTGAPLVITDATNLEASIPVPCLTPTTRTYTFTQPGKYLVICGFLPHFQVGMYGWVEVKE